ncbi:TalC/MipB family fructose-6-phosphate aldolase [Breznakia sp. PF5-3]|uniref:transaldolase family protein n=1 Tax=unclassified Breznakia TaxID=2623764 RepID=UPI002406F62F|nr:MULTISPECIES: transaldolase family protein [unclassified Breznakia]MDF9825698.1 TalC/MipB family fructose-6-phosphate aldolase [Breznakia sp. PM6-1]MDF9836521.1 TalC/MipB family fructose-6-phosphate aldolase [Breznakia sp. PF5-3]MDF9837592.1 TalC/MipB family fructose-6-phosphate aldolase [Breznakia sp. PFB2-8]MDF9860755.1 TalC/MipB family fructose-6-phosphate aldolase [Breznakia sp. PH5-24]
MELILDTADTSAIKHFNEYLTIDGVTTNPTIITKSKKEFHAVIDDILSILNDDQALYVQVLATDCAGIVEEAKYIHSLRKQNIYAKIPVSNEGLKAIKECKKLGIKVLATAIYSAEQGFLAALSGADALAPYVNRMDNLGNGVENVLDLIQMLKVNNLPTKIIAASFKNTRQVHELIKGGIQAVTVPTDVLQNMMDHPMTDIAVDTFTKDWENAYNRTTLKS